MATLLSTPLTLSVIPRTFGQGGDVGRLDGDVWTPGRDAQGLVNQASWNLVPAGRWVTAAGTRMDALDARIKAAMPNWRELSTWDRYSNSWSGMAPDLPRSRIFYSGGGHGDGSNNGLYSFNFYRMAWDIEMLPSDQTLWSTSYQTGNGTGSGNWGLCPESLMATEAKIAAGSLNPINDWGLDEIYWDHESGVGKMTPKHTYGSYVYVPTTNEVVFVHRRLWKLSLDSRQYVYKRQINDSPGTLNASGTSRSPVVDTEHGITLYDEVSDEVLATANGSNGITNRASYKLSSDRWALNPTNYAPPWSNRYNHAFTRLGRRIHVVLPPISGESDGMYWIYDLDSRSTVVGGARFQFGSGLAGNQSFALGNTYYDGACMEYIAPINRYWLWTLMADGSMGCIEIDPTTSPWTMRAKTFAGSAPTPQKYICRRAFYLADQGAVWMYDRASFDWYVYKL